MPVIVNGVEFTDADMERELPDHQEAPDPVKSAMTALVLRRVLLDEAKQLALTAEDDEALIDALLQQEVKVPVPGREECLRQYQAHPERFTVGELTEASHILFQVTPGVDLDGLRQHASGILTHLLEHPQEFAEMAKANSNCPSSEVGGSLGQIGRGQTVPEFERPLFAATAGSVIPRLVETRFGFHIIQVGRKAEGRLLPFDEIQHDIADMMQSASRDHAIRQYLQLLVGRASISGIDLQGADSPLVQ
ncbi:peptidylprolyl isomerase [Undibacterium griseum]|uniref:peptidylprolyl isomerase n=1 Tax=Undibacterium griseum TaxID=2762295 RepID=A0ABR6YLH9_9BURK|nr:peptidylprolyl isomerase [Undibacterium griseum]MBC3884749.1 peptidylprolyl isomerase [Undibacterium griseum]